MYGTTSVAAASLPTLAATGLNWGWQAMMALTIVVIGGALLRLVPKKTG
jgi:hypothetical protein